MRIIRYVRNLLSGLATFGLSFVLAVIIWVTATQANDPTIIKPLQIPLTITVPSNGALIKPGNQNINVTITIEGPASILENITRDDFAASIDLSEVPFGEDHPMDILVQQFGAQATITSQDPLQIVVNLEELVSMPVPVEVQVRGDVARGHSRSEAIANPNEIIVTGIRSQVEALEEAVVTISLNNDRETIVQTRPPIFYDKQGQVASVRNFQLSSRDVEVTVPIIEAADFAEKIISVNLVGEPASGYRILSVDVEPAAVLVQGRPTQLDVLTNVQTEPIDITGLTEPFMDSVSLDLPAGIELDEFTEIVVSVEIEPFQSSQTFRKFVEIEGVGDGLEAVITPQLVRVVLFGPSPVLQSLAEDEVTVTVDLFELGIGTHSGLVPDVDFPDRGIELRSIEPAFVSAQITEVVSSTEEISVTTTLSETSSIAPFMLNTAVSPALPDTPTAVRIIPGRYINKPQQVTGIL